MHVGMAIGVFVRFAEDAFSELSLPNFLLLGRAGTQYNFAQPVAMLKY